MTAIAIGEHQAKVLELLRQYGVWSKDAQTFEYRPKSVEALLTVLVKRGLVWRDGDVFVPVSNAPEYIVKKTSTPTRRPARRNRAVEPSPNGAVKKLSLTELVASIPTDKLRNELLRRGFTVERVSVLDELVDWGNA